MGAPQPLRAIHFESPALSVGFYTLTSAGRLFVTRDPTCPELKTVQEVEIRVLALKILYQELAKYLPAVEEPQVRVVWPPFEAIKADPEEES